MTSTSARLRAAYVALAATDAVLAGTAGAWAAGPGSSPSRC